MTKSDEIKKLKYELGRYQKKVGEQAKTIGDLTEEVESKQKGMLELCAAFDAALIQTALSYGEDVKDEDNDGENIGKRLNLPAINVDELHKHYELKARRDGNCYIIGVVPREGENG